MPLKGEKNSSTRLQSPKEALAWPWAAFPPLLPCLKGEGGETRKIIPVCATLCVPSSPGSLAPSSVCSFLSFCSTQGAKFSSPLLFCSGILCLFPQEGVGLDSVVQDCGVNLGCVSGRAFI